MRLIWVFLLVELASSFMTLGRTRVGFRLFSKNPDFDRKRREQRRSKRLKRALPEEKYMADRSMELLVKKSILNQKRFFGKRLSQVPGDGGHIPHIDKSGERSSRVKAYYSTYEGEDPNYKAYLEDTEGVVDSICRNPYQTFGRFKNQEPLVNQRFYRPFEGFSPEQKFIQATVKRRLANIKNDMVEEHEGAQAYYGLQVETLFSHLSPEDMEMMRQTEIQIKRGQIDRNNPILNPDKNYKPGEDGADDF